MGWGGGERGVGGGERGGVGVRGVGVVSGSQSPPAPILTAAHWSFSVKLMSSDLRLATIDPSLPIQ